MTTTADLIAEFDDLRRGWIRPDGTLFPVDWHADLRAPDENGNLVYGYDGHGQGWLRIWTTQRADGHREFGWEAKQQVTAAQAVVLVAAVTQIDATAVVASDPDGSLVVTTDSARDLAYKVLARCQPDQAPSLPLL